MFEGFEHRRIRVNGVDLNLRADGDGPPVLLIHGFPQTHACWHRVAPKLIERHLVVAPDLRGYGDSECPEPGDDHAAYSKREMANDLVALMRDEYGAERFQVVGHDRGARVAYRMALDHPERVQRLVTLDIVPTMNMFERTDAELAMNSYHWFFLAQPRGVPERMIGFDPDSYLEHFFQMSAAPGSVFSDEAMEQYKRCFRRPEVIRGVCEDYRAGATIDWKLDRADFEAGRKITCPMLALWGQMRMDSRKIDTLDVWKTWATDVRGRPIKSGHFLAEEAPDEVLAELDSFLEA